MFDKFLIFLIPTIFGFLFDLTTPRSGNGEITNSHYNALLDLIIEERKERKKMEQYILQLEIEVKKLNNITSKIPFIQENCDKSFENKIKSAVAVLQDQMTREIEQVAVTACADSGWYHNSVVRFPDFKSSYGINNPSALESSGQFICEKPGLYLIIASILSFSPNAEYQIRKNGIALVYVRIVPNYVDGHEKHYTGTGSAVAILNKHDTLDINVVTYSYIHPAYSCLSIIKIH